MRLLVFPNIANDAVASSPPTRRAGICVTLLLLGLGQTGRSAGAFTTSPARILPGLHLHRLTTRLHVTPARIDPDDPYATLLQNYQKKKVVVDAAPKITPPEPFAPESVKGAEERLLGVSSTSSDIGAAAAAAPSSASTSSNLAAARAAEEAAARTAKAAEEAAAAAARAAEEASAKVTETSASASAAAAATKSGGAAAATTKSGGAVAASSTGTKSISAKVAAGAQAKAAAAAAAGTEAPGKVPTLGEFLKQNVGDTDTAGIGSSLSAKIAAGAKAKAAASGAAAAAAGKAPTLVDYVKDNLANAKIPSREELEQLTIPSPGSVVPPETLANAQEKLGIMKQNLMNELPDVDLPKVDLDLPKVAESITDMASAGGGEDVAAQIKATAAAVFAAAAGAGDGAAVASAVSDLVATLHLKEYGGWYVAALAALFGASQRSAREEAQMRYERELQSLQKKADEAASAAERAAEGARKAKEMVLEKSDGGVLKLQTAERAGTILGKTKMEELRVEREMMRKEMQQLKKDNVQLKAQLDRLFAVQEIEDPLFASDFDDEDEEIYDEHMTGDADEDYGNGRILAAMEEIENANSVVGAKKNERKAQDEAEKVRAQAKEDEMKLKAQIKAREEAAAAAAKESKARRSKKSSKASSGEVKVPAKVAHAAESVHPWASLAPSTLGRKTVKELSGFLQEKGVPAVDDSGKPFRKKELLDKVKSLL